MRYIWRVKPKGKRDLKYALQNCKNGDVILLAPGEYHFPSGIFLNNSYKHSIEIRGDGKEPEDVVLHCGVSVSGMIDLRLSHLTVQALHEKNALNVKENAVLDLNRVVVKGELTGGYPAIYCEEATVNMSASEVTFPHDRIDAVCYKNNSEGQINASILASIYLSESNVQLHNNQVKVTVFVSEDSILNSTGVLDLQAMNDELYDVIVNSGSRASFELVHLDHVSAISKVEEANLKVDEVDVVGNIILEVQYNANSTMQVPENEVYMVSLEELESGQTVSYQQDYQNESIHMEERDVSDEIEDKEATLESSDNVLASNQEKEFNSLDELYAMHGLHELKEQIKQFINTAKFNQMQREQGRNILPVTLHSLFMGNPGTGKTTVARLLGRVLYEAGVIEQNKFMEVTRKDLVSPNIGETAQVTQQVLDECKGGILFIDEAYALYNESGRDHGQEAVNTILTFMEDHRYSTMIIFAGYTDEMDTFLKMNSGLESRIPNKFYFEDYSSEDIAEIGYTDLMQQDYIVNEEKYKRIVAWLYSHSFDKSNARWIRNLNEKLLVMHANRVVESASTDTQTIIDEDLDALTGNEDMNKDEQLDELLLQLEELTGLDDVKHYVQQLMKQAKVDQMLVEQGSVSDKPSYHMVFAGNPGTGKTTVADIIAKLYYHLDIMPTPNVKVVDRSDLVGSYIGHTEKQTKEIIEQSMGGVLFIDEAYQLVGKSENDFGKQAIDTLITYLEEHRDKFILILAGYTNEMEEFFEVNPGLRSRIPNYIVFPDYNADEISTIVTKMVEKNWEINTELLQAAVSEIYTNLPSEERGNARWARNFTEKLIQSHKSWIADSSTEMKQVRMIPDEVIIEVKERYLEKEYV